jgi:hypothetical protein
MSEIKKLLKREIDVSIRACALLSDTTGTCPADSFGWERAECEFDCGAVGRGDNGGFVKCWREYFVEMVDKKGD